MPPSKTSHGIRFALVRRDLEGVREAAPDAAIRDPRDVSNIRAAVKATSSCRQ
jgi:hypothetical protein